MVAEQVTQDRRQLGEMGVGADCIDALVDMALADPSCGGNPVKLSKTNLRPSLEALIG